MICAHYRLILLLLLVYGVGLSGQTPDNESGSVRFAIYGDTRGHIPLFAVNAPIISRLNQLLLDLEPPCESVIVLGDLVLGDRDEAIHRGQLEYWKEIMGAVYESNMTGAKVYPSTGNHDMRADNSVQTWQELFSYLPANGPAGEEYMTYSFDIGPVHIAVINNYMPDRSHWVNLEWLEADLAATEQEHILVVGHEPAYPVDGHIGTSLDADPERRNAFWMLLQMYGVKAYLCGHEHLYHHKVVDGVHHIISGGGGGPIIPGIAGDFFHYLIIDVDESDVRVTVVDAADRVRDEYYLSSADDTSPALLPHVDPVLGVTWPCFAWPASVLLLALAMRFVHSSRTTRHRRAV